MRTKTTSVFFSLVCQGRALEKKKNMRETFQKKNPDFFWKNIKSRIFIQNFFFNKIFFLKPKFSKIQNFFVSKKIFFLKLVPKKNPFFFSNLIFFHFFYFFSSLYYGLFTFFIFFSLCLFFWNSKKLKIQNFYPDFFFHNFFFETFPGAHPSRNPEFHGFKKKDSG